MGTISTKKTRATPGTKRASSRVKLYWCTTPDHDEDWFVVAANLAAARRYHERAEGYEAGDADAELVCDVPTSFAEEATGWPSDALLQACGGTFVHAGGTRTVRIGDRLYGEGDLVANVALRMGIVERQ